MNRQDMPEQPGERYLYQPAGQRAPHWHQCIRVEPGKHLPHIVSRCLGRRDCGTR